MPMRKPPGRGPRSPKVAGLPALPVALAGPVEVELARKVDEFPAPHSLPDGPVVWDVKWDGYRAVIVRTGTGADARAELWSRQRKNLTAKFPDIAAAAVRQLPDGCVVDGELVILRNGRLSFDALQQRLVTAAGKVSQAIAAAPASYVAFDLLAVAGVDIRTQRWSTRRQRLESLPIGQAPSGGWSAPLQVSPVTHDPDEAREWLEILPAAMGVEGVVAKGINSRYLPGVRGWLKYKPRDTVDAIVGGVIGPITRPEAVIAGRYTHPSGADLDEGGGDVREFVQVGRTTPLTPRQSAELAAVLEPADPDHPWPDKIGTGRWQNNTLVPLTKVAPTVVAEFTADTAIQAGAWRHPLRYVRIRADLEPADVGPALPA
jgi:ATP-dependent DNA ligase